LQEFLSQNTQGEQNFPYYNVIKDVVIRAAMTGIFTGIILAISRVAGETAPLLFTSFNNSYFTTNMNEPISSLTVTIFVYATGPYEDWHTKAWAASFVITFFILFVTIIARYIIHLKQDARPLSRKQIQRRDTVRWGKYSERGL